MKLNYSLKGFESAKNTLVFLHGFLEDSSMWETMADDFSQREFRCVLIDLPCHGKSRFEGKSCSVQKMATLVEGLLRKLNIESPTLIGHSLGGYVGLELLKIRSLKLILLHSNFWADPDEKKRDRDRVIGLVQKAKDLFIQEAIPHLFYEKNREKCAGTIVELISKAKEIPAVEIAACTAGLRDRRAHYELFSRHQIDIIHGENDPILPMTLLETEMAKIDKKARVHFIPDCGHMGIWEAPEALQKILFSIIPV